MKNLINIFAILALFTAAAFSQTAGDELLKKVQSKYSTINDLSANFSKINNGDVEFNGAFYYKKPNKLRLELNNLVIVSDGSTNWNFNKKDNRVIISEYSEENPELISIDKILYDYPSLSEVTASVEKGSVNVLTLTPKENSGLNYNSVNLYINSKDLIDNVIIERLDGEKIHLKLIDIEVNTNVANSKFLFEPPKGSKVIDLR